MIHDFARIVTFSLLSTLLAGAAGCAGTSEETDTSGSESAISESDPRGEDITVLSAGISTEVGRAHDVGPKTGDVQIDIANCAGSDCSAEVQRLIPDALLVGTFSYDWDRSGICETIAVTTLTREASYNEPTFAGIGFYFSENATHLFVDKAALDAHPAPATAGGDKLVTLKDGTKAIENRFFFKGMCFGLGGNGGTIRNRAYKLRPFARFDDGGTSTRVWDSVPTDYRLGRVESHGWVEGFNRGSELFGR